MATEAAPRLATDGAQRRGRAVRLSSRDKLALTLMVGIPLVLVGGLIWFPTIASIVLSFTNWDGIGGITTAQWIGTENYHQVATIYPPLLAGARAQPHLARIPDVRRDAVRPLPRLPARQGASRIAHLPEHLLPARGAVVRDHRLHRPADLLADAGPRERLASALTPTGWATRASTSGPCSSSSAGGTPGTS